MRALSVRPAVQASGLAIVVFLLTPQSAGAAAKCDKPSRPIDVSATPLAFGIYSPGSGSATESNGLISVYCADSTNQLPSFTVALSAGNAGNFNPRLMQNGANTLRYNIFIDAGYSIVWGDGTSGTTVQSYGGNSGVSLLSYTDYGQLFAAQFVSAGLYADSIVVTVSF